MLRSTTLLVLLALLSTSCDPTDFPHGACEWVPPQIDATSAPMHCRDGIGAKSCGKGDPPGKFTPQKTCRDLAYRCRGTGVGAAYRKSKPDGACWPGSEAD